MEESLEYDSRIKRLVKVLRGITISVQVVPFVCGAVYIVVFIAYLFASDAVMTALDTMFYISPLFCAAHLLYSKILHLCAWHRTACLVPVLPQVVNFIDYYIVSFSEVQAEVFNLTATAMTVLLLISAYNVFLK